MSEAAVEKRCKDCGQVKPLSEFYRNSNRPPGWQAACKPCHKVRSRRWRKAHPEAERVIARRSHLRRYYDLSDDEYDALFAAQGGVCAICGGGPNGRGKRLPVDHDAETGAVRGLLCNRCNNGVGRFLHKIALLARAIEYLRDPPAARVLRREAAHEDPVVRSAR